MTFVALAAACDGSGTSDAPAPVPVTRVIVAPSASLAVGQTAQLTATLEPANATDARVRWESSAPGVVTVSATGLLTGVAAGTATVVARTADGPWALCGVTVSAVVPVSGVTLAKTSTSLLVGGVEQLVVNVLPATAVDRRVAWSSSNPGVVSVTSVGKIVGLAEGTATITVTTRDGGKTAHCDVTVIRTGTVAALTFDGVPADQINVFDGGLQSSRLSIEAIRIEPSSTPPVSTVAP